jgi:hypothetical protein
MQPSQPIERRAESRRPLTGAVKICPRSAALGSFLGQLVDVSATGFRIRHNRLSLASGQIVDFQWDQTQGQARTVWTRILGAEAESGFHIVARED